MLKPVAESKSQLPFLRIYSGESFIRNFKIEPGTWVLGREASVDVVLSGKTISRRHFQIEYEGENHLHIQDLNSSNGTFVNGKKITRAPLGHGDEVKAGEFRIRISHLAYARPNVIPFPKVKTEPQIDIERFQTEVAPAPEAVVVRPLSRPEITKPPKLIKRKPGNLFRIVQWVLVPVFAGVIAYGFNRLWSQKTFVLNFMAPKVEKPLLPQARQIPKLEPTSIPIGDPETTEVSTESSKAEKPDEPRPDLSEIKKSLGGIEVGDLKGIDEKVRVNDSRSRSNLAALKKVKREGSTLEVDIEMPSQEEFAKAAQKIKEAEQQKGGPKFDPKLYSSMLRGKIEGVELCYYQNIKTGAVGKITVSFSISKSGEVQKTQVDTTTLRSSALEKCVIEKISKLKFDPPPWDGFQVKYGFRFGARQMKF